MPEAGQGGDDDEQRGHQGDGAGDGPQQFGGDFRQRQAVLAHGGQQDDEVVDPACQAGADDDPGEAGQVSPLGGQDRSEQRPGAGDGGEMGPEEHQSPGGAIIDVVARARWAGVRRASLSTATRVARKAPYSR